MSQNGHSENEGLVRLWVCGRAVAPSTWCHLWAERTLARYRDAYETEETNVELDFASQWARRHR